MVGVVEKSKESNEEKVPLNAISPPPSSSCKGYSEFVIDGNKTESSSSMGAEAISFVGRAIKDVM